MRIIVCMVALALGACKDSKARAPLDEVFGKRIEPPAGMAMVQPGMTLDQAKAAVPELKAGEGAAEGSWLRQTSNSHVVVFVILEDRIVKALRATIAEKEADVSAALTKAWGPPAEGTEWRDEKTGWRAQLSCKSDAPCFLDFTPHKAAPPPPKADLFGAKVGPPTVLANVTTFEDAKKVPGITPEFQLELAADTVASLSPDRTGNVGTIQITAPESLREMLTKQWGAPQPIGPTATAIATWVDAETGTRAYLEPGAKAGAKTPYVLTINKFTPAATLLGTGPDIAALSAPILGAKKDDIIKSYPSAREKEDSLSIGFPATELSDYPTIVTVALDGGKATDYQLELAVHPKTKETGFALLKQKWGEPKPDPKSSTPTWIFKAKGPRIEVVDRAGALIPSLLVRVSK